MKKRNPQDATLINIRALKKRVLILERAARHQHKQMLTQTRWIFDLDGRVRRQMRCGLRIWRLYKRERLGSAPTPF